jgi:hypothetical protein
MKPGKLMLMKDRTIILALLALGMMASTEVFAQCTPDPACVDDDDKPGQFCPLDLPDGAINVLYDETVTVIPPGTFVIPDFGIEVTILYIQIDSVMDLPPGLDYFPSEDTLYPGTAYCIQLTGTPTQVGKDTLDIYISATVEFGGEPLKAPVVDDTSLVINILETVGIDPDQGSGFHVFQNVPNPFSELTRLDYFTPLGDRIELKVYNVLGMLVHQESEVVPPGEHSFRFDGKGLEPGTYFYRVRNSENSFSGKLVKSR